MTPDQFPILRSTLRAPDRFDEALTIIADAVEAGSIRNTVLQDMKFTLSRCASEAWTKSVSDPYFHGGQWDTHCNGVKDLFGGILIMGLHDVISASKKVSKSKESGPAVDAMRAYCSEVLPLALAVASLKDKVIKGRAPNAAATAPANPNKIVKTCPVCFRAIAVVGGVMAHHGFRRPGHGWQTQSCQGIRFKPLEVSSEGLEWLISALSNNLVHLTSMIENQATQPEFLLAKRARNTPPERITRDDPLWSKVFDAHIRSTEAEIAQISRELPVLKTRLINWAPEAQG